MTEGDESEPGVGLQRVVQIENEVTGNAEYLSDAVCVQLIEEKFVKFHVTTPVHSPKPIRA